MSKSPEYRIEARWQYSCEWDVIDMCPSLNVARERVKDLKVEWQKANQGNGYGHKRYYRIWKIKECLVK